MDELAQIKESQRQQGVTLEAQNETLGGLEKGVDEIKAEFKQFREDMKPVLEIYNGGKFARNFLMGLSAFIGSLLALGAAIWMIISAVKHL